MARVNRRARGRSRRDARGLILGIVLIALAVLCAAALAYFYFTIPRAPKLNKESFCPLDGPHAVTVLLIDASDDLPTITKREISTTLSDISEGIAPYGLLELRTLGAGDTTTRILFSKCNPGDGKGASEWTSAPEVLRRRWRNEFQKPLSEALESSLRPNKSTISPIMATIQGIVK